MHKIKYYMQAAEGDEHKEHKIHELLCEGMHKLCLLDKDYYMGMMMKIHEAVYGPHFDECLAKTAVAEMENVNGTRGGHWSMDQTDKEAEKHGIHHKYDFYYVVNMLWSDFANTWGGDAEIYIKSAKAYMQDPDAGEGKAFKQYIARYF